MPLRLKEREKRLNVLGIPPDFGATTNKSGIVWFHSSPTAEAGRGLCLPAQCAYFIIEEQF
jgi:hypothetical protein